MEIKELTQGKMKLILQIDNKKPVCMDRLSRKAGITYAYATATLKNLRDSGFVNIEYVGNSGLVTLSERGIKFKAIINIIRLL